MKPVRLIPVDPDMACLLERGPECFAASHQVNLGPYAEQTRAVVEQTLEFYQRAPRQPPWLGFVVADADTAHVVGTCGFKSSPAQGAVEIAYHTFPSFEGQGYATTMAARLTGLALGSPAVRQVIAHTLPERNASTRVLDKIGMKLVGEVDDPEDGRVWRWHWPRRKRVVVEVCIASVADALAAQTAGADRLELNAALALGGLTPSLGLVQEVRRAVALPLLVMIRTRTGGFAYSDDEFRVMVRDAQLALRHGADGIAFGILTAQGQVDTVRCRQFLEQVRPLQAVFHRAFDVTSDPAAALEQLVTLGVQRILTSGQEESAYNGADRIARLMQQAAGRIEILPAGGINRFTLADVLARTGCDQVHCSLRTSVPDRSVAARPHISFGGALRQPEDRYETTNAQALTELLQQLVEPEAGTMP
jgi:copper homeostasis protein